MLLLTYIYLFIDPFWQLKTDSFAKPSRLQSLRQAAPWWQLSCIKKKKKRQMTAFACPFRPLSAFTTCIELQVTKAGEKWPQTGADTSLSSARHIPSYRPAFLRCSSAHLAVFVINHHIMWLHISMHDSHTVTIVQSLLKKKSHTSYLERKQIL